MEEVPNGNGRRFLSHPTSLSCIVNARARKEKDRVKCRRDQNHRKREHGLVIAFASDKSQDDPSDDAGKCQQEMVHIAQIQPIGRFHYCSTYAQCDPRLDAEIPDESEISFGKKINDDMSMSSNETPTKAKMNLYFVRRKKNRGALTANDREGQECHGIREAKLSGQDQHRPEEGRRQSQHDDGRGHNLGD